VIAAPKPRKGQKPGTQADASPEIARWRDLLGSEEGKEIARMRGGLSELANARQKGQQGLTQLLVRGAPKVLNVALLGALSANLLQHALKLLA
jgi:hypothetical protein